jgi:hypothetical protein
MIQHTCSKPSSNVHRSYDIYLAPMLFGEWARVAQWNHIVSPYTVSGQLFQIQGSTQAVFTKWLNAKTRCGHIRASWWTA